MKIKAHVLEMSDCGDNIKIVAQGQTVGAADWRPWSRIELRLPDIQGVRRAYWLGREISIEVKPA